MINDCAMTAIFILGFFVSHYSVCKYQSKAAKKEGIENYTIHVIFPKLEQIQEKKIEEVSQNGLISTFSTGDHTKMMFSRLTMKQVHSHFSENFGPIHRIYFGHDFHELHSDTNEYIQLSRQELEC
jgi:hypothetical protein